MSLIKSYYFLFLLLLFSCGKYHQETVLDFNTGSYESGDLTVEYETFINDQIHEDTDLNLLLGEKYKFVFKGEVKLNTGHSYYFSDTVNVIGGQRKIEIDASNRLIVNL